MNRMTRVQTKPESGHRSWRRMVGLLSLALVLFMLLSACGASGVERLRTSGALSNGEVILGESGSPSDIAGPSADNADLIALESAVDPSGSAQPIIPDNGSKQGVGDPAQTGVTDATSSATAPVAPPTPAAQAGSSTGEQPVPLPDAPAAPEPKQASLDAGILVRSENILSTSEKEALLNELERELNGLFGAIDQVSTEEQAGQAE